MPEYWEGCCSFRNQILIFSDLYPSRWISLNVEKLSVTQQDFFVEDVDKDFGDFEFETAFT